MGREREIMSNILAFDLGMTTGWAGSVDGCIHSGTVNNHTGRFAGGGMRFLRFRGHIAELIDRIHPEAVYFEEVRRHVGTDAAHVYGGLLATLTAYCEEHHIPYQGVPVGTIKKHATGRGNADKSAMITAAAARGWNPSDDNEADALWLLDLALRVL